MARPIIAAVKWRVGLCLLLVLTAVSCGSDERKSKPLSEPGERVYDLSGKIVGRDADDNTVRVEHGPIAGFMEGMTMDFSVRGAEVGELPADGTAIDAKLHVTERAYWLTEIRQTKSK